MKMITVIAIFVQPKKRKLSLEEEVDKTINSVYKKNLNTLNFFSGRDGS